MGKWRPSFALYACVAAVVVGAIGIFTVRYGLIGFFGGLLGVGLMGVLFSPMVQFGADILDDRP